MQWKFGSYVYDYLSKFQSTTHPDSETEVLLIERPLIWITVVQSDWIENSDCLFSTNKDKIDQRETERSPQERSLSGKDPSYSINDFLGNSEIQKKFGNTVCLIFKDIG